MPPSDLRLPMLLGGGGLLTLLSYVYFLPRVCPTCPVSALWFGIDGALRTVYGVSIVLSAVAFVVMSGWMLFRPSTYVTRARQTNECTALAWFFAGAVLWSVTLWLWGLAVRGEHGSSGVVYLAKGGVLLALCMTTVGALRLLLEWLGTTGAATTPAPTTPAPWWVLLSAGYVLWHVGVLDNVGWSVAFLCQTGS